MLIWVAAMHCEAKPVIDRYRLKKQHRERAFDCYAGDDMRCIVSGIGKLAAAAATAWAAGCLAREASLAWFNLGAAGGMADIGSAFVIDKIVDDDSGECYYPVPLTRAGLPGATCRTLSSPSDDYRADALFDMEASGFFASASRFSSAELIRSLKVISDNPERRIGRDKPRLSQLLEDNMDVIEAQATDLVAVDREIAGRALPRASFDKLLGLARFSLTEENRARQLWRYLASRDIEVAELLGELRATASAGDIIARLERISRRDAEGL